MKIFSIAQSASAFSTAFRSQPPYEFAFKLFSMFPTGCCEYGSLMLAWLLCEEHPDLKIEIVTGELKSDSEQRHVWLGIDGHNIDITADQFDKTLPVVLITCPEGWHDRYALVERRPFDMRFYDDYWEEERLNIVHDYQVLAHHARVAA